MNTAYKVILSNKIEIKIDQDELQGVIDIMGSGSIVRVRQGIFNPSFVVAIVEDEDRLERFYEAQDNRRKYNELHPEEEPKPIIGFKPLKNVFDKELKKLS